MSLQPNFGYPWVLSYGHLILAVVVVSLWLFGRARRWRPLWMVLIGALGLWSVCAFLVTRFVVDVNGRGALPTERFLASGEGRVLDMGAGTGRSALMVLEARPKATLVALDLFGESYRHHFGAKQSGPERLAENLRVSGVESRATIQTGDMRKLPFETAGFDGVVSAYAIDHLNRAGATEALGEAFRVLKPHGEFLLMVVGKDPWLKFTFGPLLLHSDMRGPDWWSSRLQESGFRVVEHGTRPITLYFLSIKP